MLWLIAACLPPLVRIITNAFLFKGTVSVISSDTPCTHGNVRFTTVPLKPFADHLEDFHILLYFRNAKVNFVENPHTNTYLTDEGFEGTVVNQALSSLHGESHEITLTVPLKRNEIKNVKNEIKKIILKLIVTIITSTRPKQDFYLNRKVSNFLTQPSKLVVSRILTKCVKISLYPY